MKIKVDEDYGLIIEEVYGGFTLRTREGNELSICMRDDTFEMNICPKGKDINNWKRVNMQTGEIVDLRKIKLHQNLIPIEIAKEAKKQGIIINQK